jgi:hypothetical protein
MQFEIIWPEKRWVTAQRIAIWYGDAVANGKISADDVGHAIRAASSLAGPELQARALHNAGLITLGRGRRR